MMMNVAMCMTAIMLTCCIVLSSGASLLPFDLPNVKVAGDSQGIQGLVPPPTPPKDSEMPSEFSKDGPPMYSDVEDEGQRYRLAAKWCINFHYLTGVSKEEVDDMPVDDLKKLLDAPLRKFKQFYRLEPVNGELTNDVLTEMSSPRCADKDDKVSHRSKRHTTLGNKWSKNSLSVSFDNYLGTFSKSQQEAIARHCTGLWGGSSGLSFSHLGGNGGRGDIYIQFKYIDGAWGTVGQGLSPSSRGSHLYLDSSESWKLNKNSGGGYGVSLTWAMCHEMGHNLGLGHSSDRNAIMYPSGTGQDDSRLGSDDANGIRSLYPGGGSYRAPAPRPTTVYRPTSRPTSRPTYRPTYRTTYRPTYRPTYRTTYRSYRYAPPGHVPRYRPTYSAHQLPPVSPSGGSISDFDNWFRK